MCQKLEVQQVIGRFMNSFDLKDWILMRSTLTDTLVVDYRDLKGEAPKVVSAVDYVDSRETSLAQLTTHHLIANFDINIHANSAKAKANCLIYRTNGEQTCRSHAVYTFALRLVDHNSWKIAGIKQKILWNEGESL